MTSCLYNLVLIVVLINCVFVPRGVSEYVECKNKSELQENCQCKTIDRREVPWPKDGQKSAPSPSNVSVTFSAHDGSLYPTIRWKIDRNYLQFADGFFMEVMLFPNLYWFYSCSHDVAGISSQFDDEMIEYEFAECCRSLFQGLRKRDTFAVTVFSLPLYASDEAPNMARTLAVVEEK